MNILDSELWNSDLDEIVNVLPELKKLEGKTLMITGCTGLICSAVIDILVRWNQNHDEKIIIIAAGRNEDNARRRFDPFINEGWFSFLPYDATNTDNKLTKTLDYIIHGASNASPNIIINEPVETMMSNIIGVKTLLDYSRETNVKRLLYISSSEVYGKKQNNAPSKIDDYGWIDILNPRNSYSISKCAAETMCSSYSEEFGVNSVIVRPGHIYGPTASKTDSRVSSVWAYKASRGEDIIIKSDGGQIRSYCYCLDAASAILKILLSGESGKAYNISNPDSIISIREMAELITNSVGTKLKFESPTEQEKKGFNPMNNSSLDSTDLLALGWKGLFDAERGFSHTISILKELVQKGA